MVLKLAYFNMPNCRTGKEQLEQCDIHIGCSLLKKAGGKEITRADHISHCASAEYQCHTGENKEVFCQYKGQIWEEPKDVKWLWSWWRGRMSDGMHIYSRGTRPLLQSELGKLGTGHSNLWWLKEMPSLSYLLKTFFLKDSKHLLWKWAAVRRSGEQRQGKAVVLEEQRASLAAHVYFAHALIFPHWFWYFHTNYCINCSWLTSPLSHP